jgi:hypothetical protein
LTVGLEVLSRTLQKVFAATSALSASCSFISQYVLSNINSSGVLILETQLVTITRSTELTNEAAQPVNGLPSLSPSTVIP